MKQKKKPEEVAEAEMGQVIPFPQRSRVRTKAATSAGASKPPRSSGWPRKNPGNLTRRPEGDDYRQRMLVNVSALAICTVLVVAGVWMATTMAELRKHQDCVLSGRTNCAPITAGAR